MHVGRAKRRCQGVEHRLAQRTRPRFLFIADAKKTVTHAHIELARTRDFQSQFVKCAAAGASVERRLVRTITDEIETFLILEPAANPAAEIIRVANRNPAGLPRKKIQSFLRLEGGIAPRAQRV